MFQFLGVLFLLSLSGIIGAFTWPYAINAWLALAGHDSTCLWWHGFLLGYVTAIGQLGLPAAAITWIFTQFL